MPIGAEVPVELTAGDVRKLLQTLIPVVGERQGVLLVESAQAGGGGDHGHNFECDGERAAARVLFPQVNTRNGSVLSQVDGRLAGHVIDRCWQGHAVFLESRGQQYRKCDFVELHRRIRIK